MSIAAIRTCAICLEEIKEGERTWQSGWFLSACRHVFHMACMTQWLNKENNCPLCRTVIPIFILPVKRQDKEADTDNSFLLDDQFPFFTQVRHLFKAEEVLE